VETLKLRRRGCWIVGWGALVFSALLCEAAWGQQSTPVDAPSISSGAPLPPVPELMQEVEKNEDVLEKEQRDYTYHVHTENQELDGKGDLKKTETRDAESFTVDGILVNRTVAKDGKTLTPDEMKKENERIDKEVAKAKERKAKLDSEGKATDENGNEELTVSRILQLGTFANERRIDVNGRSTIVVDYVGDPNAKTKTRFEAVVRDLVGTVWVDERDRAIVQVQGHFVNDFKIGGGLLADIKKESNFSGKFTKVNGEAWLPAEFAGEGKVRILLFAGFNGRFRLTTSDYKKFRASATILPGEREVGADGEVVPDTEPEKQKP